MEGQIRRTLQMKGVVLHLATCGGRDTSPLTQDGKRNQVHKIFLFTTG